MVTPSNPPPPMNNFCLYSPPVLRCFWKDLLMTPPPPSYFKHPSLLSPFPSTISPPLKILIIHLHNKYVFIPAYKDRNNIIIICKRYYINTLIKELGLDNCSTLTGNSTYTSCQMSSEDIVNTHDTFMKSLGIEPSVMTIDYLTYIGPPSYINLQ